MKEHNYGVSDHAPLAAIIILVLAALIGGAVAAVIIHIIRHFL